MFFSIWLIFKGGVGYLVRLADSFIIIIDPSKPRPQITSAIDVWALGVTLFCLLFARCPFMADNEFQLLHCIAKEELMVPKRRIRPEKKVLPDHLRPQSPLSPEELLEMETEPVDDDLRDLLKRLLIKDPSQRITLKEVKRHPWVLYGIKDPCSWVDETDPERMSDGNRIEVTVEDVEKAVSSAGVLNRARSAMKKAGAWYRGLRKRASSAADVASKDGRDGKDRKSERKWEPQDAAQHLQGYYHFKDDEDKELQWMGGAPPWNEDRRPSVTHFPTNGSAASTDTVQHLVSPDNSRSGPPTPNLRASNVHHLPEAERHILRRKPSVNFLGSPRRHCTHGGEAGSVHRSPSICSTSRFCEIKGENASPVMTSPQHGNGGLFRDGVKRMVGRMRSGNLSSDNGKDPISREGSPLRARDALVGHLRSGDHSFYAYGAGSLQVQIPPYRRHSYTCEQIEASVPLDRTPRFSPGGMAGMFERASIGRAEEARRKLGALEIDSNIEPCPPSPDDSVSMEKIWGREQQKRLLQLEERQKYSQPSLCVTPGWVKENYYFPTRDSPTPPIAIDSKARSGFFDDQSILPSVPPHHGDPEGQLVSSSSEEQFATTAGSSLTNSTSFPSVPSVLSESSSISSDFYGRYSRKSSIAGLVEEEALNDKGEYEYQRRDRPGTPYRDNANSYPHFDIDEADEIAQCDDGGDEGEESDGGFVLKIKPRSESVTMGELARRPLGAVEAPPQRTRRRSRSSSGTVREGKEKRSSRGRTKGKTVVVE